MNNFKRYTNSPSPYSKIQKNTDLMTKNKMTLEEAIKSKLGTYTIMAHFEEDLDTVDKLEIPGVIGFLCKLSVNGKVCAVGRGQSVISPSFKVVERLVANAFSSCLIEAIMKGSRVIESLNLGVKSGPEQRIELKGKYEEPESEPATEKQINYLRQLITVNESDEDVRENKLSTLETITKEEASNWIESYRQ